MAETSKPSPDRVEAKRERSTIDFPYLDLDDSVEITKGVHAVGGTSCQKEQLAAQLGQSATSGGFHLRITTSKMFGFLMYERGTITLTDLGLKACDSQQEKAARVEAFLTIPLYKAVYEKYKTATLPPTSGLETEMVSLGVASKQKERARQVFQRSAKQAGFFDFGPEKLILPFTARKVSKPATAEQAHGPKESEKQQFRDIPEWHPFIEGLLKTLPDAETEWPVEDRKKWLQAAANIFDLIYTSATKGSLKIETENNG